jgi:hypothetical protein
MSGEETAFKVATEQKSYFFPLFTNNYVVMRVGPEIYFFHKKYLRKGRSESEFEVEGEHLQ